MSSNKPPGGVRNLRALFENKPDSLSTSPPSRGRSPSNTESSAHSRPVSKVRASFVAVERPGELGQAPQWGLRKASDVSSIAEGKESAEGALPRMSSQVASSTAETPNTPSHARHTTKTSIDGGLGSILKGSAFESSSPPQSLDTSVEEKKEKKELKAKPEPVKVNGNPVSPKMPPGSMVTRMHKEMERGKLPQDRTTKLNTETSTKPLQPKMISEARPKATTNSPTLVKSPRTPVTPSSAVSSKLSPKTSTPAKSDTTVKSAREVKAPAVKVPAAVKKVADGSQTNGVAKPAIAVGNAIDAPQTNGSLKPTSKLADENKAPKTRRAPRASAISMTSSLAKKAPRASLPVQPSTKDRPKSRVSTAGRAPDEGFLARMMRPTASSAQKVHEKVTRSPPRTRKDATKTIEDKENKGDAVSPVD